MRRPTPRHPSNVIARLGRRSSIAAAAAVLAVSSVRARSLADETDEAAPRPPNVVIIFTDDQGYGDVGCFGARGFETPHLDRMAREGIRLTSFHVAQAVCSASRAALLTGCYPNRIGIHGALGPDARHGIHAGETTIAEVLKAKAYATAIYGKWHLGHHPPFLPLRHGFDDWLGLPYSNDMWRRHPTAGASYPPLPLMDGERVLETDPDQTRLTTLYTERAVRFIDEHKSRPFFLYLAHSMPHVPLFVSEKRRGTTARGLYGDVIAEIDASVGEVLAAIDRHGLDKDTLVIFTSDNGPWLSYGDHAGSAGPLREGKGTSWEGGVRVPFIARWPGRIPRGAVSATPAMTIDLLPTIAGLAGAPLPALPIDGKDIWPILSGAPGAASPQAAYFVYYHAGELQAVIAGKWKLILPHRYRSLDGRPGGSGGRPVEYVEKTAGTELYDLEADIGETRDLAATHPDVVARLLEHAARARADLGDRRTGEKGTGTRPPGRL